MRKLTIILKTCSTEINSAILLISMTFFDQGTDHIDHSINLLSCQRMGGSRFDVHASHILLALCNISLGDLLCRYTLFIGFFDDLVIHVSKVGYKVHIISLCLQITTNRVKYDHRSGISNMNKVIHGRTAYIHADLTLFQRNKILFFSCQCVINANHYGLSSFFTLSFPRDIPSLC